MSPAPQTGTALITGSARRIGREIASALAADGWIIGLHYNTSQREAEALAADLSAAGAKVAPLRCDLTDPADAASLVERCASALGAPTCLVNNASLFENDDLKTLTRSGWTRHLSCNLEAPVFLAKSFAEGLPAGATGNIVNLIDQRVHGPTPEFLSYTIAKSALWTATRLLAQALAPRIRVNAIAPGPVFQSIHQSPEDFAAEVESTLLKRSCPPQEIAEAVRFILSSSSMTGQMLTLDSGQHLA